MVVGVHGRFAAEPAHSVTVGVVGIGPAVALYLPVVRQLAGGTHGGLGVRQGAVKINNGLPGLAVSAAPLGTGRLPIGPGFGRGDLPGGFRRGAGSLCHGVKVQLVRPVGNRVVKIAPSRLGHQNGRHSRQLEGAVVAGSLRRQGKTGVLLLRGVTDPVVLAVGGADQRPAGSEASQHIQLDVAHHPFPLLFGKGCGIKAGAVFAVFLIGKADEAQLRIVGSILQHFGGKQQRGHAGGVIIGAPGAWNAVVMGRKDQNVGISPVCLLHGDHIGPGAALPVGAGLKGHGIAHLRKALLQILHSRMFSP